MNPSDQSNVKPKCLGFLAGKSESIIAFLENMYLKKEFFQVNEIFRGISERENGVIRETFAQTQMSQTSRPKIRTKTPLLTQRSSISNSNNNQTEMQGFRIFRKRASTGTIYPAEKQTPEQPQPQPLPIGLVAARCLSYNKLKYPIKAVHKSGVIASQIAKITPCNVRQIVTYKGAKFGS